MLCELCHKGEASGVLRRKGKDGEEEELYVCSQCLGKDGGHGGKKRAGKVKATIITADGEEPPAFVKELLDAAAGIFGDDEADDAGKEQKCRMCGTTWEKIRETKCVGCPDCWVTFGDRIKEEFHSASYGPTHKGRMPERGDDGKPSVAFLEKELKDAVARQNYRKAARIKRQIEELSGKGGEADGGGGQ